MNRKNLEIIEKRVNRLTELVRPRPRPTEEQELIIRVAVALISPSDMPPYSDQKARKELLLNSLNIVGRHQNEIDGIRAEGIKN